MHVFVTGATGWVGSAVVAELIKAGHSVTGLSRTKEKAQALSDLGADVVLGTLSDLDLLSDAAKGADGVIHTAFNHDFSRFAENVVEDENAIKRLGATLLGTDKPLLITSGLALLAPGRLATEADMPPVDSGFPRRSDAAARELREQGVRVSAIRLSPSVHGMGDHGFVPILIRLARETGVAAYIDDGLNRWAGVQRFDVARLYRLALEQGAREPVYHGVGDEGVPFKDIAAAIGRGLGLPVESRSKEHFGWFGNFAAMDMRASSAQTQAWLGWQPTGPRLLEDLSQPDYYQA